MKEHIVKDRILKHICDKGSTTTIELCELFEYDHDFIIIIIDEFDRLKYISKHPIATVSKHIIEYLINIQPYGRFFLNQSGGYKKSHNQYIRRQIWIVAKTIANIIEALAIIIIGIWGVCVADKSNKIENLESEIQILKHENDSLKNQTHFLLGNMKGRKPRP